MSSSTYKPLTGREVREIAIFRLTQEINKLPYLREGNAFHNTNVQIALVMTAYPADVPVPNLDFEFEIPSKELDQVREALDNQIDKAEELAGYAEKLDNFILKAQEAQIKVLELRNTLVFEKEVEIEFNGNLPDKTRMENNLPITVEKVVGGKKTEVKVTPIEFSKMVKQ